MNKWKSINGINISDIYTDTLRRAGLNEPVSYIVDGIIIKNDRNIKAELGYIIDVYSDDETLRCVFYREM